MATINESIGREALLAFASQYSSMSEALMELIDNPFDYRRGRHLTVEVAIDKRGDLISVLDHGGEGMNAEGLAEWIGWGTGHRHEATDIGQYHVGGKLAAIYLAEGLEITCRKAGERDVWRFADPHWGSRTDLFRGEPEALAPDRLAGALGGLAARGGVGFTCVTLRGLNPHRYEQRILAAKLANAYRSLIMEGHCSIVLDGDEVAPLDIPVSASFDPTEIPNTKLESGVRVRGRIWVTDRDRLPSGRGVSFKAGVRTVFNGRTITEGEEFGHYLAGRGTLQRLVGEIQVTGVRPNTTKTGWHQDSPQWQAVEQFMYERMSPLVAELNNLGDARPISREQKKRAESVRRRIAAVLKQLGERSTALGSVLEGEADAPGGRKPPAPSDEPRSVQQNGTHTETRNRTEPPDDAVGRLLRRYGGNVPPIEFDQLGRAGRSQWRDSERGRSIVLNTDYPIYERFGDTEEYMLESAVMHLLTEEGVALSYAAAVEKLDEIVWLAKAVE